MTKIMTDRELLELAAKACGMTTSEALGKIGRPISLYSQWDPLNNDGDALRLAVRLGITVGPEDSDVIGKSLCRASWDDKTMSLGEYGGGDAEAAFRRAIVRAAASIGTDGMGVNP